jgi:hypothetical protein
MAPDKAIEGWSTLIKPIQDWVTHGTWSPASAAVHGIGQEELETGMAPTEAVAWLNSVIREHAAFCDGGPYDLYWARTLARASGIRATFKIGDFDMLTAKMGPSGYERFVRWLDRAPPRHRARDDAERLMKALARGYCIEHGKSITIRPPLHESRSERF